MSADKCPHRSGGWIAAAAGVGAVGLGLVLAAAALRKPAAGGAPAAGAADKVKQLESENKKLRERVDELEDALPMAMGVSQGAIAAYLPPALNRSASSLSDGSVVSLSVSELHNMRAIFKLFDADQSGAITADELQELHAKLGEPLTDEEAVAAIEAFSSPGSTQVSFEEFVKYWNARHEPDASGSRRGAAYKARFKFMAARVANPEVGRIVTSSEGTYPSLEYRVRFYYDNGPGAPRTELSPWHDVPLRNPDGSLNFICEIPKYTRAKFEISTGEPFNPIKQDTKNGRLREYGWGDMVVNYGAFPQTWEDPAHITPGTGAKGDNDPLDVMEIGMKRWATGAIVRVKVLGVLALVDSGETDWKVIAISEEDPMAHLLNDVEDVEVHLPGLLDSIHHWLKMYKSASGTVNQFGYDGKVMDREFAEEVVEETNAFWKALVAEHGHGATVPAS